MKKQMFNKITKSAESIPLFVRIILIIVFIVVLGVTVRILKDSSGLPIKTDIDISEVNNLSDNLPSEEFVYSNIEETIDLQESCEVIINTENLMYIDSINHYYIDADTNTMTGLLKGQINKVNKFYYEIYDDHNIIIDKGDIAIEDKWHFDNFGLVTGENTLKVITELNSGQKVVSTLKIMCGDSNHLESIKIDKDDTDNDGLINYLEEYYGTDKNNPDSDNDGLSDYIEIAVIETNPLKVDSDDNGTSDDNEDYDGDKLVNGKEILKGTNIAYEDSDYDGLNDCEEINTFATNPINEDTDKDGANDGWEVKNGFNPLAYNESFETTVKSEENNGLVASATVGLSGEQVSSFNLTPSNNELLTESTPGYIGGAFDFGVTGEFSTGTISFELDSSMLTDEGIVPTIYYFNEETQLLEELETNIDGNIASTTVHHFSTYMLLNKIEVDKVWENDIKSAADISNEDKDINVCFLIDVSGSMNIPDYTEVKNVMKDFINELGADDYVSIIKFKPYWRNSFKLTNNKIQLENEINRLVVEGVESPGSCYINNTYRQQIVPALQRGIELIAEDNRENTNDFFILLTDGFECDFLCTYSSDAEACRNKEIKACVVNINLDYIYDPNTMEFTSPEFDYAAYEEYSTRKNFANMLEYFAVQTGGKYYHCATENDLTDRFEDLKREIIDYTNEYINDTNSDGISDYHTRLMCEGKLTTGTGFNIFNGLDYADVQANDDYDGDGLKNGEEITIKESQSNIVYAYVNSNPLEADTDLDGLNDNDDPNPRVWDVCDRDLAIFAALAYERGYKILNADNKLMYDASDIVGSKDEPGQNYYFLKGADISFEGIDKGISSKWILVDYVNEFVNIDTYFSATTFRNGNNIVVAYRGTDDGLGEWICNVAGLGLYNVQGEEFHARAYAAIIADKYPGCSIYITGHSLGGYLAQIGAAEIICNKENAKLKEVKYFNGIGLNYNTLSALINPVSLYKTTNNYVAMLKLNDFSKKNPNSLVSYSIEGDVVSAIGSHSGEEIAFKPAEDAKNHHYGKYGKGIILDISSRIDLAELSALTTTNLIKYYDEYQAQSIIEYFWITHETDSFYYYLSQGYRNYNGGSSFR